MHHVFSTNVKSYWNDKTSKKRVFYTNFAYFHWLRFHSIERNKHFHLIDIIFVCRRNFIKHFLFHSNGKSFRFFTRFQFLVSIETLFRISFPMARKNKCFVHLNSIINILIILQQIHITQQFRLQRFRYHKRWQEKAYHFDCFKWTTISSLRIFYFHFHLMKNHLNRIPMKMRKILNNFRQHLYKNRIW